MDILVIGGTRFFGIPMIKHLLQNGHEITIASRGIVKDPFENTVQRIRVDVTNEEDIIRNLGGKHFTTIIDKIAYCSNDIQRILNHVSCERFVHMSTTAVYEPLHQNTMEEDFISENYPLSWCERADAPYGEIKRLAECALSHDFRQQNWVAVRYPYVVGKNDYTKRLEFYVSHVMQSIPMNVDNMDAQMSFISEEEAGAFLAFAAERNFTGPINGCLEGTISIREIVAYVEHKTSSKAIIRENGEIAPYNGTSDYWINTKHAKELGYQFPRLKPWIYSLLDLYIEEIRQSKI